ncbi:Hydrogenobyrinate a,c-diamide synthase [Baekduia alba]|uniref:cobyrinate a,c-diamide synthase n=1 Tax=Baekduia alba TaxID=2997333 RepID=UPI0023422996|nr:cobyrinate a,c-diamide synthase [Baekduia alba]WCB93013.1 Hydrogenobyrinate a,c-diamide synthase [Baekduia alba]
MTGRLVIAGTHSGAGKTTVASGLMAALSRAGQRVAPFKVGPDFIDPSYHRLACGRPGRNLDAFLSGPELIAPLVRHGAAGADLVVVEGVMGLFDGASGSGELASTAQVAKLLDAPVVLVVDASAMARSVAAIVHGFATFDPTLRIGGVVLNRVASDWHEELLREAIAATGVPIVGVLRRDADLAVPERHLGLVPAVEREAHARRTLDGLAAAVAAEADLEALLALARSAPPLEAGDAWSPAPDETVLAPVRDVRIAVASGPAFSFRYEENHELLAAAGAELVPFDPLVDEELPARCGALLLAGGFPEVFGAELSENWALRAEVAAFARRGRPILAECGGLLYLSTELDGRPMCDVVPARARMGERLTLGYRSAAAVAEHPVWPAGSTVRGHEFHYSLLDPPAGAAPAWTLSARGSARSEGHVVGGVHASYLHTHWAATPAVAWRLVAAAAAAAQAPEVPA